MAEDFETLESPDEEEGSRNTTLIIIAVVIFLMLCCCCLIIVLGWFYGDAILELADDLAFQSLNIHLAS